jgi:hypothetical protein
MRRTVLFAIAAWTALCQTRPWTTHTDPLGFTVQTPAGWQAAGDRQSGRVTVTGPGREQVIVWPVFMAAAMDGRSAPAVLQRLAGASGVNAAWDTPQALPARAVRMTGRWGDRTAVASFTWTASAKGTAGYLFVVAAPNAVYRAEQDTLTRILESFRAAGAPIDGASKSASPGAPAVNWVRWQDPKENAFSIEVPAGWKVNGGLFRFAPLDTRPAWEAVSPDGQIRITGGDPQLGPFTEPNQVLAMAGFREGSEYSPGYGLRYIVRRYVPGAPFVREYVAARAPQFCTGLAITDNRDRSDADAAINVIYQRYGTMGVMMQIHSGEVSFTCNRQGRAMAGYYFASTLRTQSAGMPGGLWLAQNLCGYLAPRDQAQLAQSIAKHIVESGKPNPQWENMQSGITMNSSRIAAQTQEAVSNIISETYWSRQKTMDEISRRRENAILGTVDVVDPASGKQIKVDNSANYYWMDNRGMIAGTQTDTRPNLDFRELTKLP